MGLRKGGASADPSGTANSLQGSSSAPTEATPGQTELQGQRVGGLRAWGDLGSQFCSGLTARGPASWTPTPSHAPRYAPRCHTGPTTLTGPKREALGFDQEAPSARGEVAWQAGKGPLLKSATRGGRRTQSPSEAPSHPGTAHQEILLPASPWAGR